MGSRLGKAMALLEEDKAGYRELQKSRGELESRRQARIACEKVLHALIELTNAVIAKHERAIPENHDTRRVVLRDIGREDLVRLYSQAQADLHNLSHGQRTWPAPLLTMDKIRQKIGEEVARHMKLLIPPEARPDRELDQMRPDVKVHGVLSSSEIYQKLGEISDLRTLTPPDILPDWITTSARPSDQFERVPPFDTTHPVLRNPRSVPKGYTSPSISTSTLRDLPTVDVMNKECRAFYRHWLDRWHSGDPIKVDGYVGYLFAYTFDVLWWHKEGAHDKIISELRRLRSVYAHEEVFRKHVSMWLADTYILKGEFENALATLYSDRFKKRDDVLSYSTLVTLKHLLNEPLEEQDVVKFVTSGINIPSVTDFSHRHEIEVANALTGIFREYEAKYNIDLLEAVTEKCPITLPVYLRSSREYEIASSPVLNFEDFASGFNFPTLSRESDNTNSWAQNFPPQDHPITDLPWYRINLAKLQAHVTGEMVREAENRVREARGIPHIGEGWVSETELYYLVSALLKPLGYDVRHHARPSWLKSKQLGAGQELDIYVPGLKLAIEYMGRQHYEPIEYFGGKRAHEKLIKLDKRKRRACERRGIHLIYYRYYEPLEVEHVRKRLAEHPDLTLEMLSHTDVDISRDLVSYRRAQKS